MVKISELQKVILKESLQGRTYQEIADTHYYCHEHVRQQGIVLWEKLSNHLRKEINKRNIKAFSNEPIFSGLLQKLSSSTASADCDRLASVAHKRRGAGRVSAVMER